MIRQLPNYNVCKLGTGDAFLFSCFECIVFRPALASRCRKTHRDGKWIHVFLKTILAAYGTKFRVH